MKRFLLIGLPVMFAATPALATGGFDCRTTDGSRIRLSGVVGRTITAPLVAARLEVNEEAWSTADPDPGIVVGRSWIDARETRVDLVDPNMVRFEAQLRARHTMRGTATGTVVRNGVSHPVQCTLE
jgi:hypothetical protein